MGYEAAIKIVETVPYKDIFIVIGIFCIPIFIACFIYLIIISPIICNFYIVPAIERKMGRRLGYHRLVSFAPFGKYLNRQYEISRYILNRYYAWKKYGEKSIPFGYDTYALKQVGYTIDKISKGEVLYSFLVRISLYLGWISIIFGYIAASLAPPH